MLSPEQKVAHVQARTCPERKTVNRGVRFATMSVSGASYSEFERQMKEIQKAAAVQAPPR